MKTFAEFFGFKQDPFKRTPDIEFYYPTKMHQDALDTLTYLLWSDEAFAVIVGEPGTGKTITLRKFISELPDSVVFAYILFPNLSPEELFMAIIEDFNIKIDKKLTKNTLFARLRDFLIDIGSEGRKAVIIIDEAQNLPADTLEELRLLSNLETDKDKLLKIVLAGQPELQTKLDSEELRQLKQRITLYSPLSNIDEEDIRKYIDSHLEKAGRSPIKIQGKVMRKIARITKGNPRLINTLMERAIIAAFLDNSYTINEDHLTSAISSVNTIMSTIRKKRSRKNFYYIGAAAAALAAIIAFYFAMDKIINPSPAVTEVAKVETAAVSSDSSNSSGFDVVPQEDGSDVSGPTSAGEVSEEEKPAEKSPSPEETTQTESAETEKNAAAAPVIPETLPAPSRPENASPPTPQNTPEPDYETYPMPPGVRVVVSGSSVNVRSSPSLEGARITSVSGGMEFEVVDETSYWAEISVSPLLKGWVYKKYLRVISP